MMLYKNTKIKVCSPDSDTDYFDIVADVLQGNTSAPYQFIICQDDVLRMSIKLMKENGCKLTKERRRYPAQTIKDADHTDDIELMANTPALAETQLHSLEWAAVGIDVHVNADKMEYMNLNKRGDSSTLHSSS